MKYKVKNWDEYQHYKDRNPPWIKLHFAMLTSEDWVMLDDASRVLAVACLLVASRHDGHVPHKPAYIKRVAYLNTDPDFKPLIECGFLEPDSECKQVLANARPEERRDRAETETEGETERKRTKRACSLPPDFPSSDEIEWAKSNEPTVDPDREAAKFRDHFAAKSGKDATKKDWPATWRNWIRRAAEWKPKADSGESAHERATREAIEYRNRKHGGAQ